MAVIINKNGRIYTFCAFNDSAVTERTIRAVGHSDAFVVGFIAGETVVKVVLTVMIDAVWRIKHAVGVIDLFARSFGSKRELFKDPMRHVIARKNVIGL